ncbi:LppA family lipoprotein [Saccharopolyspora indica]|uniref:LppA family lipoprotein n=1 Tax=Saccharopolyspora indica TaxID=1229659 RepID=UPI0022EA1A97|nr:LppA family lipoprotein [Saccharopolyspora indica]MDA3646357.1 LppA family lipoprotein [Saccharopolyspora indica]
MRKYSVKWFLLLLLFSLLVSGCGGNELTSKHGGDLQTQRDELLRRPGIEEASARYQEMLTRMRDGLAARFTWMRWGTSQELIRAGCAEFDFAKDDLESQTLGVWVAFGDIPDAEWPEVQLVVTEIAAGYGFGSPRIMSDRPGDHTITALDQYGASYSVTGGRNISLNGSTGCHLPQAVKDRIAATGQ